MTDEIKLKLLKTTVNGRAILMACDDTGRVISGQEKVEVMCEAGITTAEITIRLFNPEIVDNE